jgi:large subunit ribosomal protein L3
MKSIIGRKVGMTQVFATDGAMIPVTVIEVLPNVVIQKKSKEKDGYQALRIGYEDKPERLVNKPDKGQYKNANTAPKRFVRELVGDEMMKFNVGDVINPSLFKAGEIVDVTGLTKGRGFAGVIKRHGFHRQPMGHGSGMHRGIGTLATSGRTNNRIHPGIKMPGHYGNETVSILNLTVVGVDDAKNALLIKGAIPGPNRGLISVRSAIKFNKNIPAAKTLVDNTAKK